MILLAIETSGDLCGVAVRDEKGTLVERTYRHRMRLSERLMCDVDAVLADAGITLEEVEGLAVGLGPGSFTGVRVGVMAVKTWADLLGKPVAGVSALEATAARHVWAADGLIVPVIRARPDSLYAAAFEAAGDGLREVGAPELVVTADLGAYLSRFGSGQALLCGEGLKTQRQGIEAACSGMAVRFGEAGPPRAADVAAVAERRLLAGRGDDPLTLVPLYVAPPPIGPRAEQLAGGPRPRPLP